MSGRSDKTIKQTKSGNRQVSLWMSCVWLFLSFHSADSAAAAKDISIQNNKNNQVLVQINDSTITVSDLQKTLASSPFGIQFNTMDKDAQASLRGVLLKRLVSSRLLLLEARKQKLANTPAFQQDLVDFRKSLLYRRYMDQLRESVKISKSDLKKLMLAYKGQPDALTAARSTNVTQRYRLLRVLAIQHLRDTQNVKTFEERIKPGIRPETILLQGRNIRITYGDLTRGDDLSSPPSKNLIKGRLYQQAEVELVANAAATEIDVARQVQFYQTERLPTLLRDQLERQWLKPDRVLNKHYKAHPEIGSVATRWHIGQLVIGTRNEAERLRNAIAKGASLFKMAGQYSIDPFGKSVNGDMGWLRKGVAHPDIEKAIKDLKEGDVSAVIKTPLGFHLVTVLDKRQSEQLPFVAIKDKVHQNFIEMKMTAYLKVLQKEYTVVWKILQSSKTGSNGKT